MRKFVSVAFILIYYLIESESAKILWLLLAPVKSHSLTFVPLIQELTKSGHEIVVVTVEPINSNINTPKNIIEIDIGDISYKIWINEFEKYKNQTKNTNMFRSLKQALLMMEKVFVAQCKSDQIQKFVNEETNKFDLILYDGSCFPSIVFSHIFKAPVIPINSAMLISNYDKILGITGYLHYYIHFYRQTIKNLSVWETYVGLYEHFSMSLFIEKNYQRFDDAFKETLAPSSPPITELYNNIHLYLVNIDTIWDGILPRSSNMFYLGHIQKKPYVQLPKDIQTYLDSSKNGVIYMSFGTNVLTSILPPKIMNGFLNVISQLPYDVLWKWDSDDMPNKPENLRTFKWLPQADVLNHPNIKLFITQAGQHSTDEAIHAGVPLIGIPLGYDQITNAEKFVHYGIGKKLDFKTITPEKFKDAICTVIGDESYRRNITKLRTLLQDKPLSSMEKAIWAIEYVIRHGGAHHMRSPASNLSWAEYFEFELLSLFVVVFAVLLYLCMKFVRKFLFTIFFIWRFLINKRKMH